MTPGTSSWPIFEASLRPSLALSADFDRARVRDPEPRRQERRSQVDMAFDILKRARSPLHISAILERFDADFGIPIDRESLVSSLTKKVARGDRFLRPDKNTFSLRPEAR